MRVLGVESLTVLGCSSGRPGLGHRGAGLGEAAGVLLVAGARRVLVADGAEPSGRRDALGHVVRRREVLCGEWRGRGG